MSSGESSVLRKSKASRALSMDTLMLDDRELDRDPRDCFCNTKNTHNCKAGLLHDDHGVRG